MYRFILLSLLSSKAIAATLGPPKLLDQPPEEVWFQAGEYQYSNNKLILKCQASENAEKFIWKKDGEILEIGGDIEWQRPGQSGSVVFVTPREEHQGYYQCFVSNIFGTAVTNRVHLQLGVLEHFKPRPIQKITVVEGDSLTLDCSPPFGVPLPAVFWLYRDTEQGSVIETVRRRHIAVDGDGKLQFTAVEAHDGRPNLIYECAASSPVLHGEYRAGDQIQLEVKSRRGSESVSVHPLYFSPDEVTVKAGAKLKLQCIFGGRPAPVVFWSKLDGNLPKERMKDLTSTDSDYGKTLVIDNVHPEDAGKYECRAQHITHQINVRVLAAPYWEYSPPSDIEQSEDSTGELECLASGRPPPLIRWSLNGKPLHELEEDTRRILLDNGRILRIKELNHDLDTGVFQCNASNPLGYVYANAFVLVKAHAPRFLMPPRREWKVVLRSNVDLTCEVEAAPDPVVRWVDADDRPIQIVEGKTMLFPNHTLRILDVNTADEGLYYCNVSNKYGINRAYNRLHVYKPTYFLKIPSPRRLTVEAGESVSLSCEAVSDPRLDIQYKWTLNGRIINGTKTFQFEPLHLLLSDVKGRHSGIIDCAAITDVDVKVATMQLIVKDVPQTPPLEGIVCSERKGTIKWLPADPHGDEIKKYTVEMMTDFKKGYWEKVYEEANSDKEIFETDITLTPWVNFTFRVVAENAHGRSDKRPADIEDGDLRPTVQCHTRPSFPYTNPDGVRGQGNQPDNLVIFWNPLDKYYWNAPNLQYLIRYKLNLPDTTWNEFIVEDSLAGLVSIGASDPRLNVFKTTEGSECVNLLIEKHDFSDNHSVIRDQPTFNEYLIQVKSVNALGPSILVPETVIGYSGEDVPSNPPTNINLGEFLNFTTLNITWDAVDPESVNGHFEGYEIEYWERDSTGKHTKVAVPRDKTNRLITTFHPNTNYTAVIRTRNRQYGSEPSAKMDFTSPEGVPSKVHNLRVFAVGAHSILVQWEPPRQPNGFVRGYFITFENDRNETEETYVLHRQTSYLHEKAHSDSGYKVSVWGETKAGEGARTLRPVRTWPIRAPDIPMFKVTNVSTNSIDIQWIPHNHSVWRMPGSSFYVNYSLGESGRSVQSPIVFLPETKIKLEGLIESSRYILLGIARDGKLFSHSDPLYIDTASLEEASHLNQESLRNAAWFIAVLCAVAIALLTIFLTCCCEERKKGKYFVRRKEIEIGHQLDADEERTFLEYQYGCKE